MELQIYFLEEIRRWYLEGLKDMVTEEQRVVYKQKLVAKLNGITDARASGETEAYRNALKAKHSELVFSSKTESFYLIEIPAFEVFLDEAKQEYDILC